jgi:hypothetical protein
MRSAAIQGPVRAFLKLHKLHSIRFPNAIVLPTSKDFVQFIFSPLARPRALPAFAKNIPPRRRTKNALHYHALSRTAHKRIARYVLIRFIA